MKTKNTAKTKWCPKCQRQRRKTSFHACTTRSGGLQWCCKKCNSQLALAYSRANPTKVQRNVRRWQAENREQYRESAKWTRIKRRYGLTRETHAALVKKVGGKCQICRKRKVLHIDHDHRTGKVRGLLCVSCNNALGKFGDTVAGLLKAIAYLQANK